MPDQEYQIGDRVEVHLDSKSWSREGWFPGTVVKIERYSEHRSFHWVQLDAPAGATDAGLPRLLSVLNPRNIRKV